MWGLGNDEVLTNFISWYSIVFPCIQKNEKILPWGSYTVDSDSQTWKKEEGKPIKVAVAETKQMWWGKANLMNK